MKENQAAGTLYIVPTPVGNLEDMTFRAVDVLRRANLILAEDTRTSSTLMRHYDIHTPMESHHKFNEHQRVETVIRRLLAGENIALVSDAGTPGISDPGFMLSRACRREGIRVECLPGATAFVPALVSSGLPCDRFCFEGFLPPKKGRATRLTLLAADPRTVIIYESPKRLERTLRQLAEAFGSERPAAVCREISKLHETIHRDSLGNLADFFSVNQAKGEIVVVIEGDNGPTNKSRHKYSDDPTSIDNN
ncbi:MAG: 16S rRNA (cytidine(1402)-2'-O)-methyltransferase [Clostridium sp.]|nr:16S rRNA (cytidine(1402)-2'-O)-methyltransferase [Prevotella sp.]MCM1378126.1 16S rRNA (cytidine(1402)-2'-O)-methyltransferase [Prevotella sp.]MCM1428940.1 16S rRNA (cytidine(1402)-2'-O)-methyltransferase [Clostridium sp.]MCM1475974.1 16S rRNA (cytidine(1402)-2'-O)-methyltransferase [Muribaculaceae bacterium]